MQKQVNTSTRTVELMHMDGSLHNYKSSGTSASVHCRAKQATSPTDAHNAGPEAQPAPDPGSLVDTVQVRVVRSYNMFLYCAGRRSTSCMYTCRRSTPCRSTTPRSTCAWSRSQRDAALESYTNQTRVRTQSRLSLVRAHCSVLARARAREVPDPPFLSSSLFCMHVRDVIVKGPHDVTQPAFYRRELQKTAWTTTVQAQQP